MFLVTKKVRGKPYIYLGCNEKLDDGKWRTRCTYLAKTKKLAAKKLATLPGLSDDERCKLINSLDSDCWRTPAHVIAAAREVMGAIDLDPATLPNNPVGAASFYTKETNGLAHPWAGNVWLNPPYGAPKPFILKLCQHYQDGDITAAIALVKSGVLQNTGTAAHIHQTKTAVCHWRGRLEFEHSKLKQTRSGADFDVAAIYWGADRERFAAVFAQYGFIS